MVDLSSQPMSVVLKLMARDYVDSDEAATVIAEQVLRTLVAWSIGSPLSI